MQVSVPVSVGELFDKITILVLKARLPSRTTVADTDKLRNVLHELQTLQQIADHLNVMKKIEREFELLRAVNRALWDVEDELRLLELKCDFGPVFVKYARAVYQLNDERAALKRTINEKTGSTIVEEKFYRGQP